MTRGRLRRWLKRAAAAAAVAAVAWLAGFAWFVHAIPTEVADHDQATDAIVVLTGGSLRVQSGLALLAAGKAKKLFVSGVYHGVDVSELLRVSRQSPESVACCIALGHAAESTFGNALETASWMRAEGFRSLRLVTANYHMPRSLLEFSRALPGVVIVPYPVFPEASREQRWWARPASFGLLVGEYGKFLVALVRPYILGAGDAGNA